MSAVGAAKTGRSEADRLRKGGKLRVLLRRPEMGAFVVMVVVMGVCG